jgi:DNA-binding NtrC family response regulator
MSPNPAGEALIVDDDPLALANYSDILSDAGHTAITASTVAQAWGRLLSRPFDLVICDHDLTDGKGLDLLAKMEAAGIRPPVIYLSAALPETMEAAMRTGLVKMTITKPVDAAALLEAVRSCAAARPEDPYPRMIGLDERLMLLGSPLSENPEEPG